MRSNKHICTCHICTYGKQRCMRLTDETGTERTGEDPKKKVIKSWIYKLVWYLFNKSIADCMCNVESELSVESTCTYGDQLFFSWLNVDANCVNQTPVRTRVETDDTATSFHIHGDAESISSCYTKWVPFNVGHNGKWSYNVPCIFVLAMCSWNFFYNLI